MGATVNCVDIVGKGVDLLVITVVVLDRNLDRQSISNLLEIDRFVVQHRLVLVEMFYEFRDAAAVIKLVRLFRLFALIFDRDADALVKKSFFTKPLRQLVETELDRVENLQVRSERDFCSALAGLSGLLKIGGGNTAFVLLFVSQAFAPNLQVQPFRKKIDARDAYTVQSARYFVSIRINLAAGMQLCHYDFGRRFLFLLHHVDGNTAAVI